MKVVLIGPVYPFRGGIAHYTAVLNQELLKAGHEVLLVSFRRQYPRWLFPGRTDRDPSVQTVTVPNVRYLIDSLNPLSWFKTFLEIRSYRPRVVVFQWWHEFWAPVWLVLGGVLRQWGQTRIAMICHNVLPHERRAWDKTLARLVLKLADQVVVQSTSERTMFLDLVPSGQVEIVPHPLYDLFDQKTITRKEARQRLGITMDVPLLLFFGFVREYKGVRFLIDALPAVRKQLPDIRLLVVGEFWDDRRIYEQQIEALGLENNVSLIDRYVPNEDVAIYFKAADLVVLPYTAATQSGVLQLALGFGVPVISTRVGGISEAVVEGEDVILVEPADSHALSSAILSYFDSSSSHYGVRISREHSQKRWESLVNILTHDDA